ncbi:methyltransferase domain-containing protein [Nannocystis sp. SCPEA4]|uniref:class I SAM-dependent methyltransferase n=1 Tax=Nannocystis sp. SCPEA4 TaxID=2996787 RepID=UPI002271A10A|nr:methyltransferase domain-containing protein [Nannocystis sp. SCPEA4]MCY1054265.1 methyltransferase domain-containing protein [Nannocystis sp. SCPEA4]
MDRSAYDKLFELEKRHFWRIGRRHVILDILERWRPEGALRILDVGGACSLISQEMTRFGEVTVVEPDVPTAEFAARELGLDVRPGSLPDDLPVEGQFDVVTLFDVLEHIDDEDPAMAAVARLVRPGGLLVVTVPALPILWSDHDVSVHHRRRYTKATLRPVLERAGFRIERLSYHTCLLFPLVFAQRMASRLRGLKATAEYDVKVPASPLNRALLAVMETERRLLRRVDLPIGSSLMAICHRA